MCLEMSSMGLRIAMAVAFLFCSVYAQVKIPSRPTGYVYTDKLVRDECTVIIDAFIDVMCPEVRDTWPDLIKIVKEYYPRIFLHVHLMPLGFHDNAYVAARAVAIANRFNPSFTFPVIEALIFNQHGFHSPGVLNLTGNHIIKNLINITTSVIGKDYKFAMQSAFEDRSTDLPVRTALKYGNSRGVVATPAFFLNGFILPGSGEPLAYKNWKAIIEALLVNGTYSTYGPDV